MEVLNVPHEHTTTILADIGKTHRLFSRLEVHRVKVLTLGAHEVLS